MNYNILSYLIGEGFKNVFKNKKSTFAALMIMFVTMITVGLGLAGAKNISYIMEQLERDVPITLYIKDGIKESDLKDIEEYIKTIDVVNNVEFISKADALADAKEKLSNNAELLAQYTETNHPFKAHYKITLTEISKSAEVVQKLRDANVLKDKIVEINSSDVVMNGLSGLDKGVKIVFIGMGILLIAVSTVIISNTIKLTVHARRREISIMKYVGATNNIIRAPFIVEGIVIGIIAIALSLISLGGIYHLIYKSATYLCLSLLLRCYNFQRYSNQYYLYT